MSCREKPENTAFTGVTAIRQKILKCYKVMQNRTNCYQIGVKLE